MSLSRGKLLVGTVGAIQSTGDSDLYAGERWKILLEAPAFFYSTIKDKDSFAAPQPSETPEFCN